MIGIESGEKRAVWRTREARLASGSLIAGESVCLRDELVLGARSFEEPLHLAGDTVGQTVGA